MMQLTKEKNNYNFLFSSWVKASSKNEIMLNENSNLADKVAFIFKTFEIDKLEMMQMFAGQDSDLKNKVINTYDDLIHYCYQVAGTVGCMIFPILSKNNNLSSIRNKVIDIGIAMQLTNILRDIHEDAIRNRVFIPDQLLVLFKVNKEELKGRKTKRNLKKLIVFLSKKALFFYESELEVIQTVDSFSAKFSLKLAIATYKKILEKIIDSDFEVLEGRIYVTNLEKAKILDNIILKL